jgi:uncharacterized alpha-E superfamily protein
MLSRVADSLNWMSRYMERTDSILRVLRINHFSSQDDIVNFTWQPVLHIFTDLDEERIKAMEKNGRQVLHYMVIDRENNNSVFNMVTRARENARGVQDNITKELWQVLNEFYHRVRDPQLERALRYEDPVTVLDSLVRISMQYYGVADSTMFRGEGLCFMNIGKFLERAIQTNGVLEVKFSTLDYDIEKPTETTYWKYLLLSVSGYALYLKRYRSAFEGRNVVEQVIFDNDFPRSLIYSLNKLHGHYLRLEPSHHSEAYTRIEKLIGKVRSRVHYANVDQIAKSGLQNFLKEITGDIQAVGTALNQVYFAYS